VNNPAEFTPQSGKFYQNNTDLRETGMNLSFDLVDTAQA
jgi:hypothetical protein